MTKHVTILCKWFDSVEIGFSNIFEKKNKISLYHLVKLETNQSDEVEMVFDYCFAFFFGPFLSETFFINVDYICILDKRSELN